MAGWWVGSGLACCLVACLLGCLAGIGFLLILVECPLLNCEKLQAGGWGLVAGGLGARVWLVGGLGAG